MKSVLPVLAVAALAPFAIAGCVVVDSQGHVVREEKRFTVTGRPELKLSTFDGAIEIRTGDSKTVVVEIEKRGSTPEALEELKIESHQDGNRIDVEVKRPRKETVLIGLGRFSATAKLIVTMPRDGNVNARSGDGSIRIEQVRGVIDLHTGDGSVRASDISGQVTIGTGDGSVTVDNVEGDLDVNTGDGSVSVAGKLGAVKLHTSDGSITFRAESGTEMKADWSIDTGDGGVALYLPSDFAAELDARTGDGTIRSEFKLDAGNGESGRRSLRGALGAGGKILRIRTGDGSIRLKAS